jgi:carboxymethylenebutenolidase
MKNLLLSLTTVLVTNFYALSQSNCCNKPSGMAVFASNKSFHDAHLIPNEFHYESENGKMITYKTNTDLKANAFFIKAKKPTKNVLIVVHEWWGLNDFIKQEAEVWQKELMDVDVYAIDLYDGKIGANPEEAGALMQGMKPERATDIVKSLLDLVGKDANIATIGWCMGGSWSFQSTLLAEKRAKACVMYYGFPEKDKEKMKLLATNVLFIQGKKDAFITNESVATFEKDLKSLNKNITVKSYDAGHAFANPSNPKFDKVSTEDAHKIASTFLKKGLGL